MLQGWAGAPRALLGCWAAGLPPLRACFSILPVGQFSVTSGGCDPHGHPHAYVNNSWDANVPRARAYFTESTSQAEAWETAPLPTPGPLLCPMLPGLETLLFCGVTLEI